MKLTILTSALAMALVAAGVAHAAPFDFLNGPGAREDTAPASPPPFNVLLNHPGDSGLVYVSPEPTPVRHHHRHYYY
jgi:hypothetical protein